MLIERKTTVVGQCHGKLLSKINRKLLKMRKKLELWKQLNM